ncbi:MAG: B12-binding domain-containing protein [Chloroflexi bacterium]|nr:B12-binding domain-containing protein [Chloroflexota bacterium]
MEAEPIGPLSLQLERALLALDRLAAADIMRQCITAATQVPPVDEVVVPALKRIGDAWEDGQASLSQVYMSGRILEDVLATVLPPAEATRKAQPRTAIATLADYHFLGKRIVYCTLRTCGYDLLDYGHVQVDGLVQQVEADRIEVLLLSTLMLPLSRRSFSARPDLSSPNGPSPA